MVIGFVLIESSPFFKNKYYELMFDDTTSSKLKIILSKFYKDRHNCFHCVTNHTSFNDIEKLLQDQERNLKIQNELKYIRALYNILNMINLVTIFIIFGGPRTVTVMTMITLAFIFGSIYVENIRYGLWFDSAVIVVSFFVLLRSLWAIALTIIAVVAHAFTRRN
jgi:uncharacterized membrane protein YkgB